MGSFLLNCFVSKQTIPEGVSAVVIPLVKVQGFYDCKLTSRNSPTVINQQQEFHSVCYANSFWEPLGVKIHVTANDYGEQTLNDTIFNRISILTFLNSVLHKSYLTEKGDNQYHELAFDALDLYQNTAPAICALLKKEDWGSINEDSVSKLPWKEITDLWAKLHEVIDKNRVFLRSYQHMPQQLQLGICLQDAYDFFVEEFKDCHTNKQFNRMVDNYDKEFELNQKFFSSVFNAEDRVTHFLSTFFRFDFGETTRQNYTAFIHDFISKLKQDKTSVEDVKKLRSKFSEIFEFIQFQAGLNELNIKFLPMYGGSQDYHNENGKFYKKMVTHVGKLNNIFIKKKYDE